MWRGSGASISILVEINSGNEREYMQFRTNRELALNIVQSEIRGGTAVWLCEALDEI